MDPLVLIPIALFCAVTLIAWGMFVYVRQWDAQRKLLEKIESDGAQTASSGQDATTPPSSMRAHLMKITHFFGRQAKPKDAEGIARMQVRFLEAGIRSKNAIMMFFGLKVLLAILLAGLFLSLQLAVSRRFTMAQVIFVAMVLAAVGFYLPNLWLRIKTDRRKEELTLGFPDALDLLVVCAEAGMGLDAAMKRVGDEIRLSNKVLSDELNLLNMELRAGKSRRDALRDLAARTGLEDVGSLSTLLIQTDKFGTSVAQALRVQSDSMRVKRTQRVEELAAKLPVKLLFPTILFIFPSLFVVLMGPALISVYRVWTR
jgi:tight adherence protein C